MDLSGKVIFLTGGSKGIGLECAIKYKEVGALMMIMANDAPSLEEAKTILGKGHSFFLGDVSLAGNTEAAIKETISNYGQIDVIHNNAGISYPVKPLHDTSEDAWELLFAINVKSILHTTRFGLQSLKQTQGCILNTSSLVGEIGQENHAAYSATKGAINALTKSMALDYAPHKIRVNAVAPAGVWTPMLKEWAQEQKDKKEIENYLNNIHALGYCPQGDVIADVCVFLASDKARFITGTVMPVSGGAELGYRKTI